MKATNSHAPFISFGLRISVLSGLILLLWLGTHQLSYGAAPPTLPIPVKLTLPTLISGDEFGNAVAIDGDTLVVGAWRTDVGANKQQGIAYLFTRSQADPTRFTLVKTLTGSDSTTFDGFGAAVAVAGDTVVVGAVYADPGGVTNQGAAYIFQRDHGGPGNWGEVTKLTGSDNRKLGNFGTAVAIHGDLIAVGAPTALGAVFLYGRNQGGADHWGEIQRLTNNGGDVSDSFGQALALDDQNLVIGAPLADMAASDEPAGPVTPVPLANNAGVVFIFQQANGVWQLKNRLLPSDANPVDIASFNNRFGSAVALNGDLLYVGATSGKVNNLTTGKVFVHQRDAGGAGQWGEVAVLSASDGAAFDFFGRTLYATANGLFVGSSKGSNGSVYFFRNPGSVAAAATAPTSPQAWTQVYSFSLTENVSGSRFGEEMAGSGNTLAIGAVGYNGAQGGVFSYPLDALLAADPNATPAATASPTLTPSPTPPAHGTPVAQAVYLPLIAGGSGEAPAQTTGMLTNNGILTGPGGVKLGAVANTLTSTIGITLATSTAPSEPLPDGATPRSAYFRISGERNLLVDLDRPLVISLPVPAGADTGHLVLTYLQPATETLDTGAEGDVWSYLPGVYDAEHNLFFAKLPFLQAQGTPFILIEDPSFVSPPNGASIQASTAITGSFAVACAHFKSAGDCTSSTETYMATFLNGVYQRMTTQFGYPQKPRLLDANFKVIVTESYAVQNSSIKFGAYIFPNTERHCKGNLGYYQWWTGFLVLCLPPRQPITSVEEDTLIHEYFHANQFAYPLVEFDADDLHTQDNWIIEGMAEAAVNSYNFNGAMKRSFYYGQNNLHKVDIALTSVVTENEYLAQDFWVYTGQRFGKGLEYQGAVLALGGARTTDVARALETLQGVPFADLYWGWVKNQVMEKVYDLGGGLGNRCELTNNALTTGKTPEIFPFASGSHTYPITGTYEVVAPLTATVVKLEFPHTQQGAIVHIHYADCAGIADPDAQAACEVEAQKLLHSKIYVEQEPNCEIDPVPDDLLVEHEGYRDLKNLSPSKNYYVVIANGDRSNAHGFLIFID